MMKFKCPYCDRSYFFSEKRTDCEGCGGVLRPDKKEYWFEVPLSDEDARAISEAAYDAEMMALIEKCVDAIMKDDEVPVAAAAQAGAVTVDDYMHMIYKLPANYRMNCIMIMTSQTEMALRMLKDGHGQYLWQPTVVPRRPSTFYGYPVYNSENMHNIPVSSKEGIVTIFVDCQTYMGGEKTAAIKLKVLAEKPIQVREAVSTHTHSIRKMSEAGVGWGTIDAAPYLADAMAKTIKEEFEKCPDAPPIVTEGPVTVEASTQSGGILKNLFKMPRL
jgi:hypothetical protein